MGIARLETVMCTAKVVRHAFFASFHPSASCVPAGCFSAGRGSTGYFPCGRSEATGLVVGAISLALLSHLLRMGPVSAIVARYAAPCASLKSSA